MTPADHPTTDHGAAGFCTDHAQPADRPTAVAEAVHAGARALTAHLHGYPSNGSEADHWRAAVGAVLEAVGYAALLDALAARDAEVERLRAGRELEQNALRNALPIVARAIAAEAALAAAPSDGYCTCHPDRQGSTPDCGIAAHRAAAPSETEWPPSIFPSVPGTAAVALEDLPSETETGR